MNLTKETIEKAVNWWVEKVTANQPHSNGDNGYTSIVTCLLADSMVKKISKKQVEVFKKELAMRIEEEAKAWTEISIGCDYGPCVMLEQAALEAGIPATNFPFKTWMYISEKRRHRGARRIRSTARKNLRWQHGQEKRYPGGS